MTSRKVLLLIVDSISNKDLSREKSPNIYDIIKLGTYQTLTEVFGFIAIGAAIYASLWPNKSNIFNKYVLGTPQKQFSSPFLRELFYNTDKIPNDRLAWFIRYKLAQLGKLDPWMASDRLPKKLVPFFKPKPIEPFTNPQCLSYPTLFDVLRRQRCSFQFITQGYNSISKLSNRLIDLINRGSIPDVMIVHFNKLDTIGHFYGPKSKQRRNIIRQVDLNIKRIMDAVNNTPTEIGMFIFSDHGMSPVSQSVDMRKIIAKFNLRMGKDYLHFLDSTMARFWAFSKKSHNTIKQVLRMQRFGKLLDNHEKTRLKCNYLELEHGNLIFSINEGFTIHPDFFRLTRAPRGMHGYAFPRFSSPVLVTNLKLNNTESITHHVNLMPTILEYLNLPIPSSCQGQSLGIN